MAARIIAIIVGLLSAGLIYVPLGFGALYILSLLYEGSGHPPLPGAPDWVYVLAFFIVCPLLAIAVGATLARLLFMWFRSLGSHQRRG